MCKYCKYSSDFSSNGNIIYEGKLHTLKVKNLPKKYSILTKHYDRSWREHLWSYDKIIIHKYGLPYIIFFVHHPIKKVGYVKKDNVEYLIIIDSYEKITVTDLTNREIKIKDDGKWY